MSQKLCHHGKALLQTHCGPYISTILKKEKKNIKKKRGYSRNLLCTVTPSQYTESKKWPLQSISQHTGSGWHLQQPPALRDSCFLWAVTCRHGPPPVGTTAHNLKGNIHSKHLTCALHKEMCKKLCMRLNRSIIRKQKHSWVMND